MPWTIYLLTDPADPREAYVGQTSNSLAERLRMHRVKAKKEDTRRTRWLRAMYARGDNPSVTTLHVVGSPEEANRVERWWIATLEQHLGISLVNSTAGGQRPIDAEVHGELTSRGLLRPEIRRKLKRNTRFGWRDPAIRAKRLAGIRQAHSRPEERQRKSKVSRTVAKDTWADPAKRKRRVAGMKRSWTEERKAAARARWADPAFKARVIAAQRVAFAKPEVKEKIRRATSANNARPKVKRAIAASTRALWADPEHRAMRMAALCAAAAKRRKPT